MSQPTARVPGIGFGTALGLLMLLLFLIPTVMIADLVGKALTAEEDGLHKNFFVGMEQAMTRKKQEIIRRQQEPYSAMGAVATDPLLLSGGESHFREVVSPLLASFSGFLAVALIATDGTVLHSVGSGSVEAFRGIIRGSARSYLQSPDGLAIRIAGPPEAPFLCVTMNQEKLALETMEAWKKIIRSDPDLSLLALVRENGSSPWALKPIGGGPPAVASLAVSLDFNGRAGIDLPPLDPNERTGFTATGGKTLGLVLDPLVEGSYLHLLVKDAGAIQTAHLAYRRGIALKITLALIGMALLSGVFARMIGTPIRQLADACETIEAGEFPTSLPPSPFREINQLERSLLHMAARVESRLDSTNRELMEQNKRLRALFQNIPDAIYVLDKRFRVVMANPVGKKRLGLKHLPPEGLELEEPRASLLQKLIETPQGIIEEMPFETTRTTYKVIGSLLVDLYGECFGYLLLERDITLEKEVDRMKTEFVSNVSHELRTPLTSIQAYTEMLIDGEADTEEQRREYLGIISQETERLTRLVNDVLDLSRIEAGRQLVRLASIDPVRVARHSCQVMERWAQKKDHQLVFQSEFPETKIVADQDLFEQALLNLLSNAIKYTPPGGRVTLTCRRIDGEARFEVRDTGIGLTEDERTRLFTKFFRADNEVAQTAGGTGLGLVLVNEITRLHGGRILVDSAPGKGSTFTLCLPIKAT